MTDAKVRPMLFSLGGNLSVFILLPLLLNGVIFGLGWDRESGAGKGQMAGLPPGWVVGAIWMVLFAGMGTARWLLLRQDERRLAVWVSAVAFLCLLYPLYTVGLSDDRIGLAGNVVTAIVAIPLLVMVWPRSQTSGLCLAALCAWLLYAAGATVYGLAH